MQEDNVNTSRSAFPVFVISLYLWKKGEGMMAIQLTSSSVWDKHSFLALVLKRIRVVWKSNERKIEGERGQSLVYVVL